MYAYKQFQSQDVIITPFQVNKRFPITGSNLVSPNIGIDILAGKLNTSSLFIPQTETVTGLYSSSQYERLVYDNIKQLYYTNYIPNNNYNFWPHTQSLFTGSTSTNHRYENFLTSLVSESRDSLPLINNDEITVISIPEKLYGHNIVPNSFAFTYGTSSVYDDGEGNIFAPAYQVDFINVYGSAVYGISVYGIPDADAYQVGNIIYSQGIITINTGSLSVFGGLLSASMNDSGSFSPILASSSISFSSSFDLFETQYKCTINENEYNFSLNPSLLQGSNIFYSGSGITGVSASNNTPLNFVTEPYFNPYITTIGLYNDIQELVAVGKLSQPLQSSLTTDTTILINFDR